MIRNKFWFYFLSFTWGLTTTLIGCIVAVVMIITDHEPQKWGYCYYFEVGKGWGGLNLGPFFLVGENASEHTKSHECGHAIQNCWFGPFMILIVSIPSVIRYWYRKIRNMIGYPCHTKYDDVWFEKSASNLGSNLTIQND